MASVLIICFYYLIHHPIAPRPSPLPVHRRPNTPNPPPNVVGDQCTANIFDPRTVPKINFITLFSCLSVSESTTTLFHSTDNPLEHVVQDGTQRQARVSSDKHRAYKQTLPGLVACWTTTKKNKSSPPSTPSATVHSTTITLCCSWPTAHHCCEQEKKKSK